MDTLRETQQMNNRIALQAADLYVLLQREFRRRQPPECKSCFMQLPFRVDRIEPSAANWEVAVPSDCTFGCAAVVEALVEEFRTLYDLKPEGGH
jgi:hypothetical protein